MDGKQSHTPTPPVWAMVKMERMHRENAKLVAALRDVLNMHAMPTTDDDGNGTTYVDKIGAMRHARAVLAEVDKEQS